MADSALTYPANHFPAEYGKEQALASSLLQQVWLIVWRNRFLMAGIVAAGLVLALIATLLATPQYTSSARVQVDRVQANVSNVEGVEPESSILQYEEFYNTQYALLESVSLAERVARRLNLAGDEDFLEAFDLVDSEAISSASSREAVQIIGGILLNNVEVEPVLGSSLIDLRFTSPSPELSARIVSAWVDEFIATSIERRFAATNDAREFLEGQLAALRERLEDSERQFVTYATNSGIFAVGGEGSGVNDSARDTLATVDLSSMNEALMAARADRIAAQSALQAGNARADPVIDTLRTRRADTAAQRSKLLTQFDSEYPPIVALTSEITELDQQIAAAERRANGDLESVYRASEQREQELQSQVDRLKSGFRDEQRATIQYNILRREVDTNRELYDGLLQRYKEIGVAGVEASNAQLVDAPHVPSNPSSPILPLNLAIGFLLSVAIAAAVLFAREQIDRSLRDPDDVKNILGLPLLGATPRMPAEEVVEELDDPKSAMAEAYLSIGVMLDLSTVHGFPRTLMLTSTMPSEGKTSSSVALAGRLARSGRRTVLVDFDMRNPSVGERLNIANRAGVTNYLTSGADLAELIQADVRPGLSVMTAGMIPPNPGELIASHRTAALIAELAERFDHVVIDAPPVLGIADSPVLAANVEGVVFVIEANRGRMRQLASAIERLRSTKGNILGAIVTKLDQRNSDYGYGQEYGYGYGYGRNSEGAAD